MRAVRLHPASALIGAVRRTFQSPVLTRQAAINGSRNPPIQRLLSICSPSLLSLPVCFDIIPVARLCQCSLQVALCGRAVWLEHHGSAGRGCRVSSPALVDRCKTCSGACSLLRILLSTAPTRHPLGTLGAGGRGGQRGGAQDGTRPGRACSQAQREITHLFVELAHL